MKNEISLTAARLSWGFAVLFLVLLAVLHLVKPELDPSWSVISEYAIGNFGWMMMLAFIALAVSCASLFMAIKSQVQGIWGKIGLFLLLLSAVGMAMAGIFVTDPLTVSADMRTSAGKLHELGAMLDVVPVAALLIGFGLARNKNWRSLKGLLLGTAVLTILGLVAFIGSTAMMLPSDGKFGPDVLIGWPNRLLVITYCVWLMTVSWQAMRLHGEKA